MTARDRHRIVIALLLAILIVAGLLRVFNIGHLVTYDEAWNVNTVLDGTAPRASLGTQSQTFFGNFYRHPPVYTSLGMLYQWTTGSGRVGVSLALEVLSIMCAIGLVLLIFLCGRDWFNDKTGLLAAFMFAVAPAARFYDTLVKQESMTLLLVMLFLFLFFRERYWLAGAFLGLSMLTKEIFVFPLLALLVLVMLTRRAVELKGFLKSLAVGVVMSLWWFIFFTTTRGEFVRFFLGTSQESLNWRGPWYTYLKNLPHDLGWIMLLAVLLGMVAVAFSLLRKRGVESGTEEGRSRRMGGFLAIWILAVYVPLTISTGKPPWMIYSALPAFALLAGWGLFSLSRVLSKRRWLAYGSVTIALLTAVALSIPVGFKSFEKGDITYSIASKDESVARYINGAIDSKGIVMLKVTDLSPSLAYYLDIYHPGSMYLSPEKPTPPSAKDRSKYTVYLLQSGTTFEQAAPLIHEAKPNYLIIRHVSPARARDISNIFSGRVRYVLIGDVIVLSGNDLQRSL